MIPAQPSIGKAADALSRNTAMWYRSGMKFKTLGNTGLKVSELCFGAMQFGNEVDDSHSHAVFNRCRDAGINFFDCADVYNSGRAEEVLGRFIADCRDEVVITSKVAMQTGKGPNDRGANRYHIMAQIDKSLRRLGTDRIDVYFIHAFDDDTRIDQTLRALDDLVAQGKILYPAASNFAAWQMAKALGIQERYGWAPFSCIQPMYNLVKRQAEVELLPMAKAEGLGVISYSPLGGGLFTGKYGKEKRPESGRLVENEMYKKRYRDEIAYTAAERLTEIAERHGTHPATLAVKWVAMHRAVTAPIIGARNLAQLEPSLKSVEFEMSDELYEELSSLAPAPPPATDRSEQTAK